MPNSNEGLPGGVERTPGQPESARPTLETPPAEVVTTTTDHARGRAGEAGVIDPDDLPDLDLEGAEVLIGDETTIQIAGLEVGTPGALAAAKAKREAQGAPTVAGKVPLGPNEQIVIQGGRPVIKKKE